MYKDRINLKNLNREEMQSWVHENGFPEYRGRQLFKWLFNKIVSDPAEMTDLPSALKELISEKTNLTLSNVLGHDGSKISETKKILFEMQDGHYAEAVLIFSKDRRTVCVSSQIGCALACKFCQTGKMGFIRNLSSGEIMEQLLYMMKVSSEPVTNVVFMGMGEPFLNFEQVIKSAEIMNHKDACYISARKITLSTAGVIPEIIRFADLRSQYKLAVSLNSPFQQERNKLMPIAGKYPLDELFQASRYYTKITGKIITFEYVLLDGLNMTSAHAEALINKLKNINCKLNLIPFNETDSDYKRPKTEKVREFENRFRHASFPVITRWSGGRENNAACGQLFYKQTKLEFE